MDLQQMLEISLRENAMLKNSINIYASNLNNALQKLDAVFLSSSHHSKDINALIEQLNTWSAKYDRHMARMEDRLKRLKMGNGKVRKTRR